MTKRLRAVLVAVALVALGGAEVASAQPVLLRGDSGPAVSAWQDQLNDWLQTARPEQGRLAVDGIFGPRTEAATREFQRAADITVDGIVGPETRGALAEERGGGGSGGDPILAVGVRGPAVSTWQENLNAWLSVNRPEAGILAVDGIFGPRTEAATIQFQRAQSITVDGKVGPETRGAYRETDVADERQPTADELLLLRGSRGEAVEEWQRLLNQVAGAGLSVDGIYGPRTADATSAFQREQGILVDGIVGPQTRDAMEDARG